MIAIVFQTAAGERHAVSAEVGDSLLQAAVDHAVPGIDGQCSGCCTCATCHVILPLDWMHALAPVAPFESRMLDATRAPREAGSRLACQVRLQPGMAGMLVRIPERQ